MQRASARQKVFGEPAGAVDANDALPAAREPESWPRVANKSRRRTHDRADRGEALNVKWVDRS